MIRERSRLTKLFLKHIRYARYYCKIGLLCSLTLFYVCSFHFFCSAQVMTVLMNYKRTVEDFKRCGSKAPTMYGLPYVSDCVGSSIDK
jgi:hypothetical protein